ncbi:nucleotide sugar dehydrogenase [Rhodomicrobium vannielii ATCC 17100]|uniref:nucleotide sugar dehydrogenase n=1 Tax=Rhodomicrobium vannielii TaxID=1069 RepID=UPI0019183AC3|nr:nucleotide sugar dehydrogenase [Rhodomicrobium vannielii]MBJ7533222.1 nucleotide sugar dehydrogenase [Rhodomicrobium vannielii ATCC 17100]
MDLSDKTIGVIGLGYVGLPLAVEFGKIRSVIGFDISAARVADLREGIDRTREVEPHELAAARYLTYTTSLEELRSCGVFIVAVPTPIDAAKRPDITMLKRAAESVGKVISRGGVAIFESTVYPGCTVNDCVPIIAKHSGLIFNRDFFVGYSPERINPGDKLHRLPSIMKVSSGSTPEAAEAIDSLYAGIITAGTYKAASIEVAEAAKVIENTQRDLNIALMNELALIFHKLGLDTGEVLAAAATKWNFLPFKPGLVGGHCIGVDPYYLTHRAQEIGYHPEVVLAGRRINDGMGGHVADRVARLLMKRGLPVVGSRILVMGLTFKENCPDLRNSRVIDLIRELKGFNATVEVWDPWADPAEAHKEFGIALESGEPAAGRYDAVILAVGHREFAEMGPARVRALGRPEAVLFDVKGLFPKAASDGRL